MSAIFGVVGEATTAELEEMGRRLAHRGPAARWHEIGSGVRLGCACVDPRPPVQHGPLSVTVDAAPWLTDEQQNELAARFARDGLHALEDDNQVFALAAWDESTQCLVLARDHLGVKPLFYCPLPGGGLAFATEYKALLAIAAVPAAPDLEVVQYLQCHKRVPEARTLLRDVHRVLPGTAVRFARSGALLAVEQMRPLTLDVRPVSEEHARAEVGRHLLRATESLVQGHRRIGVALSGGIDSIGVAYACSRCAPDAELVTFTTGHSPDDPEIRTAAFVTERLGGRHEAVFVTPEILSERLPEVVWHLEDPVGRSEVVQFLELGRAARRLGFDWLMTGMRADCIFAGMPRHKVLWLAGRLPPLRRDLLEFYALTQSGRVPERPLARALARLYFRDSLPAVPRVLDAQYAPAVPTLPSPGPEFLNRFLVTNARESSGLARIERPFQAFGVGFATPFTDRSVMDHAFRLSDRLKIRRGREKYVLRRALRDLVPAELLDVPKFPMRMLYDERFAATLDGLFARHLSKERVARRGFFRFEELERLRRFKRKGRYGAEAAMRLWTAIATEIWAEQFIDHRGAWRESSAEPATSEPRRAVG